MADAWSGIWGQLLKMQWSDYLDIVLVAAVLYMLLPLVRSTGAARILRVVFFVLVLAWITDLLDLHTMNFLINQVLAVGLIAIVVLFQPELRRMLDHLGNVKLKKLFSSESKETEMGPIVTQTVMACEVMSRERIGALIVLARDSVLDEYIKTGTAIDGQVSEQLLRNIFFPKAALHDGAAMIVDGRVAAAGCVLPLSDSNRLHADLGTRHRAGVGMSEISGAVVVMVSEETGSISVAVGGMLKRHLSPQNLDRLLRHELCPEAEPPKAEKIVGQIKEKLHIGKKEGDRNE